VEYRTDDEYTRLGLEQMLYDRYPAAQLENGGFNKYWPVALSNPYLPIYMQAAQAFLDAQGG
jgi:hypothetical protein